MKDKYFGAHEFQAREGGRQDFFRPQLGLFALLGALSGIVRRAGLHCTGRARATQSYLDEIRPSAPHGCKPSRAWHPFYHDSAAVLVDNNRIVAAHSATLVAMGFSSSTCAPLSRARWPVEKDIDLVNELRLKRS